MSKNIKSKIFGNYEIDSNGSVYNLKSKKNVIISFKDNICSLKLVINGKRKTYYLHRLIASLFIPEYNEKTHLICFKDNDKTNCSLDNLEIKSQVKDV